MGWSSTRGGSDSGDGKWRDRDDKSSRKGEKPSAPGKWKPSSDNRKPPPPQPRKGK